MPSCCIACLKGPTAGWLSGSSSSSVPLRSSGATTVSHLWAPRGTSVFLTKPNLVVWSGLQVIRRSHRTGTRLVFSGADQFHDLSNVAEIMKRPLVQHLGEGDLAELPVSRDTVTGAVRQIAKKFNVGLALIFEVIEGLLGI